jgi:hypothetical protein
MSEHSPQIMAYLDIACGACSCGFSTGEKFGDRRTANAKHALLVHLEAATANPDEYHIKDGQKLDCPICKADLDLKSSDKGALSKSSPSVVSCDDGHDFDCYYRDKTLFLFADSGPFSN